MRSALFWVIMQHIVVIPYGRFRANYLIFKGQEIFLDFLTLEDGTDRLSRNVGKELPL